MIGSIGTLVTIDEDQTAMVMPWGAAGIIGLLLAGRSVLRIVRTVRSARSPGVIEVSSSGIAVTTSASGTTKRLKFEANVLRCALVRAEVDENEAGAVEIRLLVGTTDNEAVAIACIVHDRAAFDALALATRKYLLPQRIEAKWPAGPFVELRV
jgi:hypothetical protein